MNFKTPIGSISIYIIMIIGVSLITFNNNYAQSKKTAYTTEKLVIGKKYNEKISDSTAMLIGKQMEEIKELIVKISEKNKYTVDYTVDVNNLKSLHVNVSMHEGFSVGAEVKAFVEILKRYPYIDVMVTAIVNNKEGADKLSEIVAMSLYNNGLEKDRMRVNGLLAKGAQGVVMDCYTLLVPSKEMIDKAVNGTL